MKKNFRRFFIYSEISRSVRIEALIPLVFDVVKLTKKKIKKKRKRRLENRVIRESRIEAEPYCPATLLISRFSNIIDGIA